MVERLDPSGPRLPVDRPRTAPLWPRFLWHPRVHTERAGESLVFVRLGFHPYYDRDAVEAGVRAACGLSGVHSIFAYVLFGFHDLIIRVWLPKPDHSPDAQLLAFQDQLSEQLHKDGLDSIEVLSARSLRHFAFQDDRGRLVEPDIEVIDRYPDMVLERAERYFTAADRECQSDAVKCGADDLLRDFRDYIDPHTGSTITFLVTVSCGQSPPAATLRTMGAALVQHLDELAQSGHRPRGAASTVSWLWWPRRSTRRRPREATPALQQLSLYKCAGFAHYLIMGRVMDGRHFHRLHSDLIAPINSLLPEAHVRTVTHLVAQRGLLIAEERLTGLGRSDLPPPVWSSHEVNPEASPGAPSARPERDDDTATIGGRFRVVGDLAKSRIGLGGTSAVLRVWDPFEDVHRALKLFKPAYSQAALAEANILRNCEYPGIVQYIKIGEHLDSYYVVMEYVEGQNLRQYLAEHGGPSDIRTAVQMVRQVLDALANVHPNDYRREQLRALAEKRSLTREEGAEMMSLINTGIIHRDIKPENIMIRPDGTIVVVDFGIASTAGRRTGELSGTPDYMAPDAGSDGWRPEDDIFGCGVVLYELLTGKVPYRDESDGVISSAIDIRDRRADIGDAVASTVMRACAPNREMRFESARAFSEALEAALL